MLNIAGYITGFSFGTFKFLIAAGLTRSFHSGMGWGDLAISTFIGAAISFTFFYYASGFFMERAKRKRDEKLKAGTLKEKKKFSRVNKAIVALKLSPFGFFAIISLCPIFLSVPIGSIVVAKFYRHSKQTYWFGLLNLLIWAFGLAGITQIF